MQSAFFYKHEARLEALHVETLSYDEMRKWNEIDELVEKKRLESKKKKENHVK